MKGVPMGVIAAQLGPADPRMKERHYAHLSPNYVAATIRAALPAIGIVEHRALPQSANLEAHDGQTGGTSYSTGCEIVNDAET
jgi:hypothetical protein